ncbi:hypothetical protein [Pelagibius marinus]|uniref:hypothetical protein n=1 Tax=Pelagibius marinus TaxID=2762760 RepID=UPI0018723AC8|nr:hypothetical protein [Pelagibius marinus]
MFSSLFRRFSSPCSDRRIEPRGTEVDGHVFIDGKAYPLKDWSRRGFSAGAYSAEHYPGDKIALTVELDIEDEALTFDCQAVVIWVDRERRELAGVFTDLDLRVQEKIMRSLFARRAETQDLGAPLHA